MWLFFWPFCRPCQPHCSACWSPGWYPLDHWLHWLACWSACPFDQPPWLSVDLGWSSWLVGRPCWGLSGRPLWSAYWTVTNQGWLRLQTSLPEYIDQVQPQPPHKANQPQHSTNRPRTTQVRRWPLQAIPVESL